MLMSTKVDIESILKKYKPGKRENLIPLLQDIQDEKGFLSEEAIIEAGRFVGMSTTKIYGLATFYDQFRFIPAGKIHIKICNGTSCYLNGSQTVIDKIREETRLEPGDTGKDGIISYEIVSCMGGCNHGPVISVNGEYYTNIKADQIPVLLKKLRYIIENE
jgi:NADH-quinone oxidoreductase subunit E